MENDIGSENYVYVASTVVRSLEPGLVEYPKSQDPKSILSPTHNPGGNFAIMAEGKKNSVVFVLGGPGGLFILLMPSIHTIIHS